nr:putative disease resistance protein rga4 [Quercus suber]
MVNLPDVVSLPDGWVSNLISLKYLCIYSCKELNLGSDVDGMEWRHLNRLIHLYFCDLPKLNSLPVGLQHVTTLMRDLSSLQRLEIYNCPELQRRCEKETGQDWDKIAHVTYVDI